MNSNYENIINAIQKTINSHEASLHEPNFYETDHKYIKDCIDSILYLQSEIMLINFLN